MDVKQIYELMNTVTAEVLGKSEIVSEDLSNVVDVGAAVFNASAVDAYVKSLVNHIGRVIFVNRPYSGAVPSVLMDSWEWGSVREKISADLPDASENETWELEGGSSYDPNIFYKPNVSAKFYNNKITFEVPMSFTERQIKQSFSSAEQLNGFLSMLYSSVDKALTVKTESLIMRTIDNMIAQSISAGGSRAINLLTEYNTATGGTLTVANALTSPEFIRYASYIMGVYKIRLSRLSTLFNIDGAARFTPPDLLHVVLLADFAKSAEAYLQSSAYHNEFTALPSAELVPYWQSSGTGYSFDAISKISVTPAASSEAKAVEQAGILGVMFDRDALGVCNLDRRVTTNYNAKAEFYTNWYKFDAGYFNDTAENFIVFYAEDTEQDAET